MLWTKLTDFSNFLFELPHKVFHKISLPNSLISFQFYFIIKWLCLHLFWVSCPCRLHQIYSIISKFGFSFVSFLLPVVILQSELQWRRYCFLLKNGTITKGKPWLKQTICSMNNVHMRLWNGPNPLRCAKEHLKLRKNTQSQSQQFKKKQFIIPVGLNSSGIHTPIQYYDIDYVFSMISVVLFTNSHFGFSFANVINILLHFPWKSEYFDFFHKANSPNQCRCVIKILI